MSVSYVSRRTQPTTTQLNALTAELDAIMRCFYGGKSWLCYGGGDIDAEVQGKFFYFGDDTQWRILADRGVTAAPYDHSVYTAFTSGLTVDSLDSTHGLAKCTSATWDLDDSLEAHFSTVLGIDYYYASWDSGTGYVDKAERYRKLDVAELVFEALGSSSWTMSSSYNKYHFIRFHNLDSADLTITLPGGSTVVVPKFGVQAVRRTYPHANSYDTTYTYLWKAISGDSLCFDSVTPNNVASMLCYHKWLDVMATHYTSLVDGESRQRKTFEDPRVCWDGSSLLPATIDDATPFNELRFHLGQFQVWTDATGTPVPDTFTPTWATLAAGTNGVILSHSGTDWTLDEDTGAVSPVEACGLTTNLIPTRPDTLPFTVNDGYSAIGAINGSKSATVTLSDSYYTNAPYDTSASSTVTTTYDIAVYADSLWSTDGATDGTSVLGDVATLSSTDPTDEVSTITVNWASDGWRLLAYGDTTFTYADGAVPSEYALLAFGATDMSEPWGFDVFGRTNWAHTQRNYGRGVSALVGTIDGFGTVSYDGHPDVTGHEWLLDGIEWEEARTTVTPATIKRTEVVGFSRTDTHTLPVYPADDSAEEIYANRTDSAWYGSNRTRLLAGTLDDTDKGRLMRIPLLGVHYNHVAQRLNSITAIRPLTFDDVVWYGYSGLNDGTWPYDAIGIEYYCTVLSGTSSRAYSLGATISTAVAGSFITLSEANALAAGYGFRFFRRRLSGHRGRNAGEIERTSGTWRGAPAEYVIVGDYTANVTSGGSPLEYTASPGSPHYQTVEIEESIERGATLPTGWAWRDDPKLFTLPRPAITYTSDPTGLNVLTGGGTDQPWEPVSVIAAQAVDNTMWDQADWPAQLTSQDIANMYALGTLGDPRTAWEVWLLNRDSIITRA